jgi:aspartate/methionine/tyrosine aminotransferase
MVAQFDRRRRVMVDRIRAMPGFRCPESAGAFYAFPNIEGTGLSSREAQDRFLNEAHVATLAGTSFGNKGEGYLRFSYANSIENIEAALDRISKLL